MDSTVSPPTAFINSYQAGETFPLSEVGSFHLQNPEEVIPCETWLEVLEKQQEKFGADSKLEEEPPEWIITMVNEREIARNQKEWEIANNLRDEKGWEVIDTPEGPQLNRLDN
jgi:cysteinyl-tRNA synthetase